MNIAVIIASLILLIFLCWKEWVRLSRANLLLRLLASFVATASLAFLVIPLTYTRDAIVPDGKLIIITDAMEANIDGTDTIYTNQQSLAGRYTYIADLAGFLDRHPSAKGIKIYGWGLNTDELKTTASFKLPLSVNSPTPQTGFRSGFWPHQLKSGERLRVEGRFNNPSKKAMRIVLIGAGSAQDSTAISDSSEQLFSLSCVPAHLGTSVYELVAIAVDGTEWKEKVPVDVREESRLQVLVLSSSPDFENKFLLSWLADNHYPAAARTAMTTGKYGFQFLNMTSRSLVQINSSILNSFDVVVADDGALAELGSNEIASLRQQVDAGLGLVIQTDSTRSLSPFTAGFSVRHARPVKSRHLRLNNNHGTELLTSSSYQILTGREQQSLVMDEGNQLAVVARLAGRGRIVVNTITDTYSWMLSGNDMGYGRFWTSLLNKAARKPVNGNTWTSSPAFAVFNEEVGLGLETSADSIPVIQTGAGPVYLQQDKDLHDTWTGRFWPVQKGWQTLSSGDTCMLYIYDQGDWSAARAADRLQANLFYAASSDAESIARQRTLTETIPFPKFIFFFVFVLACSFLWLEGKKNGV